MAPPVIQLNDGTKVPGVAYGTGTKWFKGPQKNDGSDISEPLVDAIKTALDVGFTHVDAAEVYGTDPEIALAIKGRDRGSLYITNKIFPGLGDIPGSAKKMVERMGPVDLYLVHAPFFDSVGQPNLKIADAWAAMEQTVADGITKSIGVSNFSVPHLEELLKSAKIKPVVNQIEFNAYLQQKEIVEFCKKNGITVAAYTPLGPITHAPGGPVDPVVRPIAEKYGMTPEQVLLKWVSQQGILVVTTSSHKDRLASFLKAVDDSWSLTADEMKAITEAGEKKHFRKYWDKQFEESDKALIAAAEAKARV